MTRQRATPRPLRLPFEAAAPRMASAPADCALPDVHAVVFHCRSLHVDVGGAGHAHATLRPDVAELVGRLRLSRARMAALVTADDSAQLLAACARAAPLVPALRGGSDSAPGASPRYGVRRAR